MLRPAKRPTASSAFGGMSTAVIQQYIIQMLNNGLYVLLRDIET